MHTQTLRERDTIVYGNLQHKLPVYVIFFSVLYNEGTKLLSLQ